MLRIIIFLVIGSTYANFIHDSDGCIDHGGYCHTILEKQCCNDYKCTSIIGITGLPTSMCLKTARLGKTCVDNRDCFEAAYAFCSKNNTCQCKDGYTSSYGLMCTSLYLDQPCSEDVHCKVDNSLCIDSKCQCHPDFQPQFNNKCIPNFTERTCEYNEDCGDDPIHVKCSKINGKPMKRCECRSHHLLKNNSTCQSLLNGYCENGNRCAVDNSVCIDNMCQCSPNYLRTTSRHCAPSPLGKSCSHNNDCDSLVYYSTCSKENLCTCKENYVAVNNTMCVLLLGGYCDYNKPCTVVNAVCVDNICQCSPNYLATSSGHCVASPLGKPCSYQSECNNLVYCSVCSEKNLCTCKDNYVPVENAKCLPLLGAYCDHKLPCADVNGVCIDHVCQCAVNYTTLFKYICIHQS